MSNLSLNKLVLMVMTLMFRFQGVTARTGHCCQGDKPHFKVALRDASPPLLRRFIALVTFYLPHCGVCCNHFVGRQDIWKPRCSLTQTPVWGVAGTIVAGTNSKVVNFIHCWWFWKTRKRKLDKIGMFWSNVLFALFTFSKGKVADKIELKLSMKAT